VADKTKIEWCDASWNPIRGCSVVSEGCRHCYAMQVAARFSGKGQAYEGLAYRNESGAHWTGKVRLVEEHLNDPLRWKLPRRIFVNSMSDLFHENVRDETIDRLFAVMALAPQHTFQILTKRPERMRDYLRNKARQDSIGQAAYDYYEELFSGAPDCGEGFRYLHWPLPNVWLGVSVEDQRSANERIPLLLQTPAAVRWLSIEPLLDKVDLYEAFPALGCSNDERSLSDIHWIVVGGESGAGARPMHPDWARRLRDQCVAAGVPFFFKQWGGWVLRDASNGDIPFERCKIYAGDDADSVTLCPVGKKRAGRLLDGREWNEYPDVHTN